MKTETFLSRMLLLAGAVVVSLSLCTACGGDDDDDPAPAPEASPTAVSFYKDNDLYADGTLVYHLESDVDKEMSVWYPLDKDGIKEANVPARLSYGGEIYTVTQLSTYAFAHCYNLKKAVIPSPVTALGDYSFAWDERLTTIGEYAFAWCKNLTSVNIPATVTSIGENAFGWCNKLENVYVHWQKPISISSSAFLYIPRPHRHQGGL